MSVLECVRPEKLILSDIDADVHSWTEYVPGDRISLKCSGGGGSDMRPLFERIEKEDVKPMVVIVITDLCVNFPAKAPDYPVIWLTEKKNGKAPFGEVIVMER
jgi:predicted metal-dependent peptidase